MFIRNYDDAYQAMDVFWFAEAMGLDCDEYHVAMMGA